MAAADFRVVSEVGVDDKSLQAAAAKIHATLSAAIKSAGMAMPSGLLATTRIAAGPTSAASVAAQQQIVRHMQAAERIAARNGDSVAAANAGALKILAQQDLNLGKRSLNAQVNYQVAQQNFSNAQKDLKDLYSSHASRAEIKQARMAVLSGARRILAPEFKDVRSEDDAKEARKEIRRLTAALNVNAAVAAGLTTAYSAGMSFIGQALPSVWGQMATRNLFAHTEARNERRIAGGKAAGGVVGAVGGAIVGGLLTGGMGGQIVGAQIGAQVMSMAGGLLGEKGKAEFESQKRTISDVQSRFKALGLYRGAYSPTFGGAVSELGQATAGDIEGMVGNAQTLAARMMFGQVSDNEMLLYSLMPNYFAAAMAGASDAELAAAYQRDLLALDPSLRLWVGSMVGGGSAGMVAFAHDKYSGGVLSQGKFYHETDQIMVGYGSGYQAGAVERGIKNAITIKDQAMADMNKAAQLEAKGEAYGIYKRQGSIPMWIEVNGKMISTNSKEYDDLVASGAITSGGTGWQAWLERQARYVGVSDSVLNAIQLGGGIAGTKESMSVEAFERKARKAERTDVATAESLDEEMEWRRRHVTQIVLNNIVEGGTTTQKIIDIMGDEAAISNEISRFNLGH